MTTATRPVPGPGTVAPSSTEYVAALARDLLAEAEQLRVVSAHIAGLDAVAEGTMPFPVAVTTYRRARHAVAEALHRSFEVAHGFRSMEEFWDDALLQERGGSDRAFWDSYENGYRRRIERLAATTFATEQAVLTNSGMAAIDVTLRSRLRPGSRLLVHQRAYFETTELLDHLLAPWGVEVVRVDATDADALAAAIETQLDVAIVETVLNGPSVDVPRLDVLVDAGVPVLLDNTAVGFGLSGSALPADPPDVVVVVESVTKYLCRDASAGIVLGGPWAEDARTAARRSGVALQGRGLHYVRPGEVMRGAARLALHTDRLRAFADTLRAEAGDDLIVTTAADGAAGRDDVLARLIREGAGGCMAYVRYRCPPADPERSYRAAVARWAASIGGRRVRAGFGWTDTSARSYGADRLNTAAGEAFVRVSVGIEPVDDVVAMATTMADHLVRAAR